MCRRLSCSPCRCHLRRGVRVLGPSSLAVAGLRIALATHCTGTASCKAIGPLASTAALTRATCASCWEPCQKGCRWEASNASTGASAKGSAPRSLRGCVIGYRGVSLLRSAHKQSKLHEASSAASCRALKLLAAPPISGAQRAQPPRPPAPGVLLWVLDQRRSMHTAPTFACSRTGRACHAYIRCVRVRVGRSQL